VSEVNFQVHAECLFLAQSPLLKGGLNRSTQHFILGRDGVCFNGAKIS
jgi:hypothetical protein